MLAHKPIGYKHLLIEVPLKIIKLQNLSKIFLGKQVDTDQIAISSYEIKNDSIFYYPYLGDGLTGELSQIALSEWTDKALPKMKSKINLYSKNFRLGTDAYGRDFYFRLIIGTRISFMIGFIAVLFHFL